MLHRPEATMSHALRILSVAAFLSACASRAPTPVAPVDAAPSDAAAPSEDAAEAPASEAPAAAPAAMSDDWTPEAGKPVDLLTEEEETHLSELQPTFSGAPRRPTPLPASPVTR